MSDYKWQPPHAHEGRIMINDGVLSMADGSDLTEYLKAWMEDLEMENGTLVCVVNVEGYKRLANDSLMFRNWGA